MGNYVLEISRWSEFAAQQMSKSVSQQNDVIAERASEILRCIKFGQGEVQFYFEIRHDCCQEAAYHISSTVTVRISETGERTEQCHQKVSGFK